MPRTAILCLVFAFFVLPCWLLEGARPGYTVDVTNTLKKTAEIVANGSLNTETRVKQGLLPVLLHIPGHLWALEMAAPFQDSPRYDDTLRWYDRRALMIENGLFTGLAATLVFVAAGLLGLDRRMALLLGSLYVFSSIALPYSRYDYHLPLAGFLAAGWMVGGIAWLRKKEHSGLWLAGASLACLLLVRLELAVLALGAYPLLFIRCNWIGKTGPDCINDDTKPHFSAVFRNPGQLMRIFVPIVIGIGISAAFQLSQWGGLAGGYEGGFAKTPFPGLHGLLFSLGKSVFIYNPALLLLPWAYVYGLRNFPRESRFLMLSLFPAFLLYAWWENWWGGWGWGPRHLTPILPLLFLPLGFILTSVYPHRRLAVRILCGLGIVGVLIQITSFSLDFNQGIMLAHRLIKQAAQAPLDPSDVEAAAIHLWQWSTLSIHIKAALSIPLMEWDLGLVQWARTGGAGRWLAITAAWMIWAWIGWMLYRSQDREMRIGDEGDDPELRV